MTSKDMKMEDNPKFFENGRRPEKSLKWKMINSFFLNEDDLKSNQ